MATFIEDIASRGGVGGGDGLGGGLLGGVILGALLGNRGGLFGGGNNDCAAAKDCVGVDGLNNLQDAITSTAILGKLGSIEAAVPYNEAQVQLALAQATSQLTQLGTTNTNLLQNTLFAGFSGIQRELCANTATLQTAIAAVDTNVDRSASVINQNILASENRLTTLITNNKIEDLQRQLTVAQLQSTEERHRHDRERDRISIETTVNQNQNQLQAQAQLQAQSQAHFFDQIRGLLITNNQLAQATNQQLIIGNAGAVAAGPQTANPTNVRA